MMMETVVSDDDIISSGGIAGRFTELSLCAGYSLKTLCVLTHLVPMKEGP